MADWDLDTFLKHDLGEKMIISHDTNILNNEAGNYVIRTDRTKTNKRNKLVLMMVTLLLILYVMLFMLSIFPIGFTREFMLAKLIDLVVVIIESGTRHGKRCL